MAEFKNNGMLKLLIIVGTRPEIIRLAAVINKCRQYFDTLLAHTGQNYDYNLNGVFFKDLPAIRKNVEGWGLSNGKSVGEFEKLIENYIRFNDIDFGGSLHTAVVKSDVCKFLKISKSKFYRDRKALLIELGIRKDSC